MTVLYLAAGYATRLYPLTKDFPKPLLKVGEKTILDHLSDDIEGAGAIGKRIIVTNGCFAPFFRGWAAGRKEEYCIADDGTFTNETRLGAVRDIQFAVDSFGVDDDLLIVAGDNVLDFSLTEFVSYAREKGTSCVMRFYQSDVAKLRKTGVACVDETGRITSMVEKPENPEGRWCIPPFYYLKKDDVPRVKEAIEGGCGVDAPGSFIAWLTGKTAVYAMEMPGRRFDIGNMESYTEAQENYHGIVKGLLRKENVELDGASILVTGGAGFIGSNVIMKLLSEYSPKKIVNLDNVNDYYAVSLKEQRLAKIEQMAQGREYAFVKGSVSDKELVMRLFKEHHFDVVIHLAAQAGVRYSIENPDAYIESNLVGFYNVLEATRKYPVKHLVYASSSSVYGGNTKIPFSTKDNVDHPVSLYAATKKSNELLAQAYAKLYGIPATGLRFFTVYGPAGRPDMAYFSFAEKLRKGENIKVFNYGNCERDFTFVDDIVTGILKTAVRAPEGEAPHKVYNIGGGRPEKLTDFIRILSEELIAAGVLDKDFAIEKHEELVPMQKGDVPVTYADSSELERECGFTPMIPLREGLRAFAKWYREYTEE